MARDPSVPKPLLALVSLVLVALLVASALTGQWAILVLGAFGVLAIALPFRNRSQHVPSRPIRCDRSTEQHARHPVRVPGHVPAVHRQRDTGDER